jgi:hypothetical protein
MFLIFSISAYLALCRLNKKKSHIKQKIDVSGGHA